MSSGPAADEVSERPAIDSPAAFVSPLPATAAAPSRQPRSAQTRKFRAAIVAILVVGAASIAAAVLLHSGGASQPSGGAAWSQWQPTSAGLAGAQQIADYLSPYYRASSAYQLAVVTAVDLNDASNPLQVVIPSTGSAGGYQALDPNSTIAYNLCGIGSQDCSIAVGTPSADRLLLLRREALDLALYSFKYLGGTQTVVALLPPGHVTTTTSPTSKSSNGSRATTSEQSVDLAVAFDRAELAPFLSRPLRETLPEALPPTVDEMPEAPESELVSVVTAHGLFSERTEQAQDGSNLLVLSPLPPQ